MMRFKLLLFLTFFGGSISFAKQLDVEEVRAKINAKCMNTQATTPGCHWSNYIDLHDAFNLGE